MWRRSKPHEFRSGNCRLVYRQRGGGPPLLLVHGLVGSSTWWRRNVGAFARYFTVYVVDLVGFGANRAWRPIGIQSSADCLAEFIATLPGGCAHVVGHSMGGQIATHLAASHPDRVNRLVLAAASDLVRSDLIRMALRLPSTGRYGKLDFAPILAIDALRAGPVNLLMGALDILSNDVSEALQNIVTPTLLIWGANDKLVPVSVGEAVHQAIRGSRFEVLGRAGHVLMWDQPEQFNKLVLHFLLAPQAAQQTVAVTPQSA
jgi:pimeloyl-ACP methyl ester carboxylesterase